MSFPASIMAWARVAAPLYHEGGNERLATWKAVLTTVVVAVALLQMLNQAFVRGWIPGGQARTQLWLRAHRVLGILALAVVLLLSALGLIAIPVFHAPMDMPDRIWHVILAIAAAGLLLFKTATTNRFRARRYLNLPLGVAALAALVAIFLITALPHFRDLYAPGGMAHLVAP